MSARFFAAVGELPDVLQMSFASAGRFLERLRGRNRKWERRKSGQQRMYAHVVDGSCADYLLEERFPSTVRIDFNRRAAERYGLTTG